MEMFLSDTDCESSSDSSCSDYLDDIDSMYGGQAQSILSNLERSIGRIDDFLAFERGFIHGDVVCYETDPSGQLGRVVNLDIVVDLETVHGEISKEINSKKLLRVCPFVVGDYVINGPWLGRVGRVVDRLTILFDDGAKCEVMAVNPGNIRPACPNVVDDTQHPYYPGQCVQIRIPSVLKSARWLWGGWKESHTEGTVCQVEAGIISIDWIASAMIGCNMNVPAPPSLQEPKDLTLLSCFTYANWQLGDRCTLPVGAQDINKEQVLNGYSTGYISGENTLERKTIQKNQKSNYEETYTIVKKRTKVDVLWQDGTCSIGLDSQSLLPVNSVGDHEFWPQQFVLEKSSCDDPPVAIVERFGIVKSVDSNERTVRLTWKAHGGHEVNDSNGICDEEIVSAYELVEHPDYSYCLGDIVFRLGKTLSVVHDDGPLECEGPLTTETKLGSIKQMKDSYNTDKLPNESSWKYLNKCYLSCIGNVVGFENDGIVVRWGSGLTSKVWPWEVVGIDKYDDSAATSVSHENTEDKMSREASGQDVQLTVSADKDKLEHAGSHVGGDQSKDAWEIGASFIPQAAIGFFKNIAVNIFGYNGSTSESFSSEELHSNWPPTTTANETESPYGKNETKCCNGTSVSLLDDLHPNREQKLEESQKEQGQYYSSEINKPGLFKQFDTVDDLSDHYFLHGTQGSMLPQAKRGWLKKVQQEWSILERDLPGTIYVRVCEQRIDLLRASIIGAPGTPYHDGLFFFDIFLPPDYPSEPPMVHYHSGGLRLNPNLYESGKICLSLLNTWMGTGTEAWNPGSSTVLQVLLSLQALVLNERPYFNEAGYDTQIGRAEGEKNSITYNENAFLLSCKSMMYITVKPPKHFEALVEEHFRCRSHSILLACKAYMDGAQVGSAFCDGNAAPEAQTSNSTGFKIMLAKLFPKLVAAFTEKGIDCSQFLEP